MYFRHSLKLISLSKYKTRYDVGICILGSKKGINLFAQYLEDRDINWIKPCKHSKIVPVTYVWHHILWTRKFSFFIESMLQQIESCNEQFASSDPLFNHKLSYYFCRRLWWNNEIRELHSNDDEPLFDPKVKQHCLDALKISDDERFQNFSSFVQNYFNEKEINRLLNGDISLLKEYHPDEINAIYQRFHHIIRDTLKIGKAASINTPFIVKLERLMKTAQRLFKNTVANNYFHR